MWIEKDNGICKISGTEITNHYGKANPSFNSYNTTDIQLSGPVWITTLKGLVRSNSKR